MLHVLVYCDLTTLNARTLPAEALSTKVLCAEGWLLCMHACRGMGRGCLQMQIGINKKK